MSGVMTVAAGIGPGVGKGAQLKKQTASKSQNFRMVEIL
jgi:hypothetical protein